MLKSILCLLIMASAAFANENSAGAGATLGEALGQQKKTFTEKMPKDVVDLFERNVQDMKGSGLEKKALTVGKKVPDASINLNGTKVSLRQIYGRGPLVLKFYRGGWCRYCMTELKHYDSIYNEFKEAGAQIIALAPDTEKMTKKTRSLHELDFDVVSDKGHELARKFGLVYKADDKIVEALKKNGIDLSVYQENGSHELSIPATYVIDRDGTIAFSFIDADYRVRAEPSDVLKAVKALKK